MNRIVLDKLKPLEDDELMSKYMELKAEILEETRGRNSLYSEDSDLIRESISTSYLSYYGVS